ncbi:MAG: ABC transporter, partial [Deltaproteobacteria bacterium]|nr:ABC transporter [Deltaproteobacteria bacterium]
PLSLGQSFLVVFPHIVAMIAITLICFAISYLVFMVQEIRT